MPFPWLRSAKTSRGGRRRSGRAQRRTRGADATPQEDLTVVSERRHRRIGFGVGGVFLFLVIGVVAFGYYQEFYKPPRVWAGSVNNVTFSMGDLVQRIRVLQGASRYDGGRVNLTTVPFEYLQDLINAEVLRQKSPSLGIAVNDEDIENELRRRFTPVADPGQVTDPGQLEREFSNNYGSFLTTTGLSDGEYRVIIQEELSEFALSLLLSREIEDPQQQVEIQWIQLPIDSQIFPNDVVKRLENEDFTRVAQELNTASRFAGSDGYVGWVAQGTFPELDDILFGYEMKVPNTENETIFIDPLPPGTISDSVFDSDNYTLVKILSGPEERELTDVIGSKLLSELVLKWQRNEIAVGTGNKTVKMKFNSRLYAWVAVQVAITAPRIDRPTPVPQLVPGLG